jgi:hypothetical protein
MKEPEFEAEAADSLENESLRYAPRWYTGHTHVEEDSMAVGPGTQVIWDMMVSSPCGSLQTAKCHIPNPGLDKC